MPKLSKSITLHSRPLRSLVAFSLVEVVVAVGIFAISIVAVIGLLAPTSKNVAAVRDTDDASRVVSALQANLQGAAFSDIITYLQTDMPADTDGEPYKGNKSKTIYSSRDGSRIGLSDQKDTSGQLIFSDPTQKYFEVTLIRSDLSKVADDGTAGFLAFTMRIRWPAFTAEGVEFTQHSQKSVLLVPGAVHR